MNPARRERVDPRLDANIVTSLVSDQTRLPLRPPASRCRGGRSRARKVDRVDRRDRRRACAAATCRAGARSPPARARRSATQLSPSAARCPPGTRARRRLRRPRCPSIAPPVSRRAGIAAAPPSPRSAPIGRRRRGARSSASRPSAHGEQQLEQVALEPQHQHLAFRIAEAGVIFDQLGPVGGQHQPGIEHARIGRARGRQRLARSARRSRRSPRASSSGVSTRRRAVGAHAAGVGAGVAVADALVILRRAERHDRVPSVSTNRLASSPSRNSSITALGRRASANMSRSPPPPRRAVIATVTPLPAASPSALITTGRPKSRRARPARRRAIGDADIAGGRDARARAQVLGEALRPLQLRGRLGRARTPDAVGAQSVGEPVDQRRLRPDHDQADRSSRGRRRPPRRDRSRRARRSLGMLRRCPGLPGAAYSLSSRGDCASFHASACSRPPEPISRTFMADPFSDEPPRLVAEAVPGDNAPALSRQRTVGRAEADGRGRVRPCPRCAARSPASSAPPRAIAISCLKDEGAVIDGVMWRGRRREPRLPPAGRDRGDRDRQAHHLSRPLQIPDRHRADGAGRRRAR